MKKTFAAFLAAIYLATSTAALAQQTYNFPTSTRIGNVANGVAATDAATVGQLPAGTTVQGGTTGTPLTGAVRILPGANVTVTQSGQDITVAATGAAGNYVQSQYAAYPSGLNIGNIGSKTTLGANDADVLVLGDTTTNEQTTNTNLTVSDVQGGVGFVIDGNGLPRMWTWTSPSSIKWSASTQDLSTWTAGEPGPIEYFSLRQAGNKMAYAQYANTAWTFSVFDSASAGTSTITFNQGTIARLNGQAVAANNPISFAISPDGTKAVILIEPEGLVVNGEIAVYTVTYNNAIMTWTQVGSNVQVPSDITLSATDVAIDNDGTAYYLNNRGDLYKLSGNTRVLIVSKLIGGGAGSSTLTTTTQGGTFRIGASGPQQTTPGGLAAIYVPATGAVTQFAPATNINVNWGCSFGADGNLYALGLPSNAPGVTAKIVRFDLSIEAKFVAPLQLAGGFVAANNSQPAANSVIVTKGANQAVDAASPNSILGSVLVSAPATGTRFTAAATAGALLVFNGTSAPGPTVAPPSTGAVFLGNPGGAASWATPGASGQVLTSTGVGTVPTFQSARKLSVIQVTETATGTGAQTFTNGTRGGSVNVTRNDCNITAPTNNGQAAWTMPAGTGILTINANYTSTSSGPESIITQFSTSNAVTGTGALNALHGTVSKSQSGSDDMGMTISGYIVLSTSTTYFLSRFAGTTANTSNAQITSTGSFQVIYECGF